MRITHINTSDSGGAFQAAYRLQQGLKKREIESDFLVLYRDSGLTHITAFLENQSLRTRVTNSLNYRRHQRKISKLLKDKPKAQFSFSSSPYQLHKHPLVKQVDIINLHWTANFLDYASFFKKIGKPVVWTLHDEYPFSGGFHYKGYEVADYQELDKKVRKEKLEALLDFKDLHIVAPSKWLHQEAQQSDLFKRFSHYHIPNGLDTSIFRPYPQAEARTFFGLPQDEKIILFVADSLEDKRKGFVYLLEALKAIKNKALFLLMLGGGQLESIGLPFKHLGFLSEPQQIAMAYAASDVFVIPSLEDNLPNTVLESLACGTPVVGFDTGGIPDMVRHGETGFLAQLKNSQDLANKISQILENDKLAQHIQKNARSIAGNEYQLELQAQRYSALYASILET